MSERVDMMEELVFHCLRRFPDPWPETDDGYPLTTFNMIRAQDEIMEVLKYFRE